MRDIRLKVKLISLLLILCLGALIFAGCSDTDMQAASEGALPASGASTGVATTASGATQAAGVITNTKDSPAGLNSPNASNIAAGTSTATAASPGNEASSPASTATSDATLSPAPTSNNPGQTPGETAPATGASPAADSTPAAIESIQGDDVQQNNAQGGGGKNIVQLHNKQDGRMNIRGSTQLNKIWGPNVQPVNLAAAQGSCTDCQTYAVALQINLVNRNAVNISPQNAAVAVNIGCTRCQTYAQALQYTFQVDDPSQIPPRLNSLLKEMEKEINSLKSNEGVTFEEAKTSIDGVITDFKDLAANLNEKIQQSTQDNDPNVTPLPTDTAEPTTVPTASLSPAPTQSITAAPTTTAPTGGDNTTTNPPPTSSTAPGGTTDTATATATSPPADSTSPQPPSPTPSS